MPRPTNPIRLTLLFASADYRVFADAVRLLRRIMGREAPDVAALIQLNLRDRDATGLADEYLDSIRWPEAAGRVAGLRLRAAKHVRKIRVGVPRRRRISLGETPPVDLSRN